MDEETTQLGKKGTDLETEIRVSKWLIERITTLEGMLYICVNSPKSLEGRRIKERFALPSEIYQRLKTSPYGINQATVDAWKEEVSRTPT